MQARLGDVRRLRAAGQNGGASAPLAVAEVERLLHELGLRARVRQVQSAAGRAVQLDLDAVDFGELAGFMLRVQEQGPGYVSGARIRRLEENRRHGHGRADTVSLPARGSPQMMRPYHRRARRESRVAPSVFALTLFGALSAGAQTLDL